MMIRIDYQSSIFGEHDGDGDYEHNGNYDNDDQDRDGDYEDDENYDEDDQDIDGYNDKA